MLSIGSLRLNNWLVMAPMAGITNLAFRILVKQHGAALVTTEMVSAMGLTVGRGNKAGNPGKTFEYLRSHSEERPLSVQIFGADSEVMTEAARIVVERGADVVDINMGCPVKKVVKTGAGAALLNDPQGVERIVSSVRKVCPVPLTVKIRAGWSPESPVASKIAHIVESCGADGITVHPRFVTQGLTGKADWRIIRKVKENTNIPVIGNGDVFAPSLAFGMKKRTGCDGVMIGRGAVGNPWIFKHILAMEQGACVEPPDVTERRRVIIEHFKLLSDLLGETRAAKNMRGLLMWYTKGLPHSSRFRAMITGVTDLESLIAVMDAYFLKLEEEGL